MFCRWQEFEQWSCLKGLGLGLAAEGVCWFDDAAHPCVRPPRTARRGRANLAAAVRALRFSGAIRTRATYQRHLRQVVGLFDELARAVQRPAQKARPSPAE